MIKFHKLASPCPVSVTEALSLDKGLPWSDLYQKVKET